MAQSFECSDTEVTVSCRFLRLAKIFVFVIVVVEAVLEEVQQIRHNRFGSFCLQKLYQVVVGRWEELNKNLANDTNTWLLYIFIQRHVVEVFDDIMYQFTESATAIFHATDGCMFPFVVQLIDRSLYLLVWTSLVYNAHEVILKALYGEGNHRNLWVAGLRKCTTDKANVVCCTAATAGLCHNKC